MGRSRLTGASPGTLPARHPRRSLRRGGARARTCSRCKGKGRGAPAPGPRGHLGTSGSGGHRHSGDGGGNSDRPSGPAGWPGRVASGRLPYSNRARDRPPLPASDTELVPDVPFQPALSEGVERSPMRRIGATHVPSDGFAVDTPETAVRWGSRGRAAASLACPRERGVCDVAHARSGAAHLSATENRAPALGIPFLTFGGSHADTQNSNLAASGLRPCPLRFRSAEVVCLSGSLRQVRPGKKQGPPTEPTFAGRPCRWPHPNPPGLTAAYSSSSAARQPRPPSGDGRVRVGAAPAYRP
jgi:hypothetical protein